MIVLGIDPGYATVGFGVIESLNGKNRVLDYGTLVTTPSSTMPERLKLLSQKLEALITKHSPDEIALEELFFNKNTSTALAVAQARGVILLTCANKCDLLFEYTPLQIKQGLTGYGRAEKHQVQYMVASLLNLKQVPKPDDAADALAVALCHLHTNRYTAGFKIK